MPIAKIREIPRDLPAARLYLDDIEELTEILLEAFKPTAAARFHPEDVCVKYSFGGKLRGDASTTSINDLKSVGGSSSYFYIHVGQWGPKLSIQGILPPDLSLAALPENEARAVYQKVESVFRHRELGLKNFLTSIPSWVTWVGMALNLLVPGPLIALLLQKHAPNILVVALGCIYLALLGSIFIFSFQPSRVVFADSYEQSRQSAEARRAYARDLVFALIGAALALLGQLVARRFR